jgi:hypothetical protein
LDPQPEFPLRTELTFFKEVGVAMPDLEVLESDLHPASKAESASEVAAKDSVVSSSSPLDNNFPSFTAMFLLWILGLLAWLYFALQTTRAETPGKRNVKKSKNSGSYKDK